MLIYYVTAWNSPCILLISLLLVHLCSSLFPTSILLLACNAHVVFFLFQSVSLVLSPYLSFHLPLSSLIRLIKYILSLSVSLLPLSLSLSLYLSLSLSLSLCLSLSLSILVLPLSILVLPLSLSLSLLRISFPYY